MLQDSKIPNKDMQEHKRDTNFELQMQTKELTKVDRQVTVGFQIPAPTPAPKADRQNGDVPVKFRNG